MTAQELAEQATELAAKLKPGTWDAVQALALVSIAQSLASMAAGAEQLLGSAYRPPLPLLARFERSGRALLGGLLGADLAKAKAVPVCVVRAFATGYIAAAEARLGGRALRLVGPPQAC